MSSIEKIKTFKDSCEQFFLQFTKNFEPKMPFEQFHKFRLYFINILYEVIYNILHFFLKGLSEFFETPSKSHMVINIFQIAFSIWDEITCDEVLKNAIFKYFFMGACFIVTKVIFMF